MITPEQLAAAGTEHAHQTAVMCWAAINRATYPELVLLHAIGNGGERNVIVASRMKAEGVKAGIPDLHLPVARRGYISLYIEMKKPDRVNHKNGGLSDEQVELIALLRQHTNCVLVCYTWAEAARGLAGYLGAT